MKKIFKILTIVLITLISMNNIDASTMKYKDLPGGSYIIGSHIFTRESGALTLRKIMFASRTIPGLELEDMEIIYKTMVGTIVDASVVDNYGNYKVLNVNPNATFNYTYKNLVIELSREINEKSDALINKYYQNYNLEDNITTSDVINFDKENYYIEIGAYTAAVPTSIKIGNTTYDNSSKTLNIGNDSFIEAPVWKIENKFLYVAVPWLIMESVPGENTIIEVSKEKYSVVVYDKNVESGRIALTGAEGLNNVSGQTNEVTTDMNLVTVHSSYGTHITGVTLSKDGETLTSNDERLYVLDNSKNMEIISPTSFKINSEEEETKTVTYGAYIDYVNGKYTALETVNKKIKIGMPNVGVVSLFLNLEKVVLKYKDNSGANIPELGNLIPVVYEEDHWVYADVFEKWYDYDEKQWANAVALEEGIEKEVGDTIDYDDTSLWYVWVPRYEYKIPEESKGIITEPNAIKINFVSKDQVENTEGYNFHPGFNFDGRARSGIWFAKYKTAFDYGKNWETIPLIRPYVSTLNDISIYNIDQMARITMYELYGDSIVGFDSHASRYLEWTAMAYLTNSVYAMCSSQTNCSEVERDASTTDNEYGIYDVSGNYQYVMAYLEGYPEDVPSLPGMEPTPNGFTNENLPNPKYFDIITSNNVRKNNYSVITSINGDTTLSGVYTEFLTDKTKIKTWFDDTITMVDAGSPYLVVGGYGASAGIFATEGFYGSSMMMIGCRFVLVP